MSTFKKNTTNMPLTQVPLKKDAVETHLISKKHSEELNRTKENLVLRDVIQFYQEPTNLEQFLAIVQEKSRISLRVLDWFVTRYSKPIEEGGLGICYEIRKVGQRRKVFNVHNSYKAQLKNNHKKLFDPFRRHNRIIFEYGDGCELETTVGQLNFFRWAISNKVLDYVEKNLSRIIKHMAVYNTTPSPTHNSTVQIRANMSKDKSNNELVAEVEFH